jgi:hypothetical protein
MAINIGRKTGTTTSLRDLGVSTTTFGFNTTKSSGGSSSGGKRSTGASDADVLSAYVADMYDRFKPEEIEYDARTEDEISASIAEWLRPSYDQAIANRKEQTDYYKAELDADAIARGMGASTYVTDVKNRQQNAEAGDILSLESDYGSTLAKYVDEGVETETDRLLEVQAQNAQLRQDAYEMAYSAALKLFGYYKEESRRSSGGSSKKTTNTVTATSAENCDRFLSLLSKDERAEVYTASSAAGQQYRDELLASVGYTGYIQLQSKYPSTP